jgi:hypothetical protein
VDTDPATQINADLCLWKPVLQIHDILVWIRIR